MLRGKVGETMNYELLVKDVPPIKVLHKIQPCTYENLLKTIGSFPKIAETDIKSSYICFSDQTKISAETILDIHRPITDSTKYKNATGYDCKVLERVKAATLVYHTAEEVFDINQSFELLEQFLSEHSYKPTGKYRIILHNEKRKWQRLNLSKLSKKGIILELQGEIE